MDPIRRRRWPRTVAACFGAAVLALAVALAFVDEPLRRRVQARVNAELAGYTVTIGELDLQPFGFALVLQEVTIVQDAHPDPPVAFLPRWRTSVQWRALLSGRLVADVEFDRPELHLTHRQEQAEAADATPVAERGWQDAVEAVYPLRINAVDIEDAALNYVDSTKLPPIRLRDLDVRASDIRNVRSVPGRFPSPFSARGTLQDTGRLTMDGRADFLAKPTIAVRSRFTVRDLRVAFAQPIVRHYNLSITQGVLATTGRLEVAGGRTLLDIADLGLASARIDYVHEAATAAREERRLEKAVHAATDVAAAPATRVTIERARLDGEFGFVDRSADPKYRLFLTDVQVGLRDFSNQRTERRGTAQLRGRFMNSGPTAVEVSFAPGGRQADFALDLEMRDVDLRTLNDLLLARGGFDVNAGRLSVYSHIQGGQGRIDGYVKPLFADMDVYDRRQDAAKGPFRRLYERAVGGVATLLENRPRDEVATVVDVSGPIEDPNSSTLEIVVRLIRNAFFKAILPGLERDRGPSSEDTG
jgi:hypothetical protein